MKKVFLTLLCSLIAIHLFSQNKSIDVKKLDSLQEVFSLAKHDTTRYNALLKISIVYQEGNNDSALLFNAKAMAIATKLKNESLKAGALVEQAIYYFYAGNYDKTLSLYEDAQKIALKEIPLTKNKIDLYRLKKIKMRSLSGFGYVYKNNGQLDKAIDYFLESQTIAIELKDTISMVKNYGNLGITLHNNNQSEKAIENLQKGIDICKKDSKNYPVLLGNMGLTYAQMGNQDKALEYYNKAVKEDKAQHNISGVARHLNNITNIYKNTGNYAKALEYAFKTLKIAEEEKILKLQGSAFGTIGIIYNMQAQIDKAIIFYIKAIDKYKEDGYTPGIYNQYSNIGIAYMQQGEEAMKKKNEVLANTKFALALSYYFKADSFYTSINDIQAKSTTLVNISLVYQNQKNIDKAIEYQLNALSIFMEIGDKYGEAISSGNLGSFFTVKKNYSLAEKYLLQSLKVAEKINSPNEIKMAHQTLYDVYDKSNKPVLALKHYKLFITFRDSLNSIENTRASVEQEMKFNFEKKATADSVKVAADKKITTAQLKQEKVQRYSLYGGLLLVALFAVFMVNRFRITNKQKKIIEEQKEIVEEKHKEITDSINYAERIQRSFLATTELLDENLTDYFVYFQPKEAVSGDFYWAANAGTNTNKKFILCTADSTGHGVPGAIMSLLNVTSLEKAVEHYNEPSEILNDTRKTIISRLKKDGSKEGGKDGMDCSLISFEFNNKKLTYAAANNPIWIVRENNIIELAGDKMPVGKHDKDQISFTQHVIELKTGDVVYTLTDGLPDQFGGPKGKKFMYKQLKQLLISIAQLPAKDQKETLALALNNWKGNMEQVDDICVIGIKI